MGRTRKKATNKTATKAEIIKRPKLVRVKALKHTVPDFMKVKRSTGIDWFDCALGGKGFTPSQLAYFTGTPGCGKSTAMAALSSSWVGNGGQALYVSGEEGLDQICLNVQGRKLARYDYDVMFTEDENGDQISIDRVIEEADAMIAEAPKKPFLLVVDSLQMMWDGRHKDGGGGTAKDKRVLEALRKWCKDNHTNCVVIGQVTKDGKMAGSNFIKHMVDTMLHMWVEKKDEEMRGCRVFTATKNRFGGCGHVLFLDLETKGFREIARLSETER